MTDAREDSLSFQGFRWWLWWWNPVTTVIYPCFPLRAVTTASLMKSNSLFSCLISNAKADRKAVFFFFFLYYLFDLRIFFKFYFLTLQYCIGFAIYQNESATSIHVFPILNPPPSSLPIPSLWVIPLHQPQASSIVHRTWTGDLFHIWYYTYFNAILPNHPTLSLSHRVQKTVLYISVSFAVSYTGLLLPSF